MRSSTADIRIRELDSFADYDACLELQRQTWGDDYADHVPATILQISRKVGGVAAGAFEAEGRMVGFVYGLTGIRDGQLAHWSHMLAVLPEYRDRGIGKRLKWFQRECLLRLGVRVMFWTYDPLVARNAHVNLNRLGATVDDYVVDLYGQTGSPLHSFGTDRFVVRWTLDPQPEGRTDEELAELSLRWSRANVLNPGGVELDSGAQGLAARLEVEDALRVEVPEDVEALAARYKAEAQRWRRSTRLAFQACLAVGFQIRGLYQEASGRCFYGLERPV